jgi:HEAT repeat protein
VLEACLELTRDADAGVRRQALFHLGGVASRTKSERILERCIELLDDPDEHVASMAPRGLQKFPTAKAIKALLKASTSERFFVSSAARTALEKVQPVAPADLRADVRKAIDAFDQANEHRESPRPLPIPNPGDF